jgi:diguanylate cyclase (GGDEF)-like protein/PAS domain S-box-containing protein
VAARVSVAVMTDDDATWASLRAVADAAAVAVERLPAAPPASDAPLAEVAAVIFVDDPKLIVGHPALRMGLTLEQLPRLYVALADELSEAEAAARLHAWTQVGASAVLRASEWSPSTLRALAHEAATILALTGRLDALHDRFALAIRGANDGMWEWDLIADRVFYSQRWKELLGFDVDDVGTSLDEWLGRVHAHDVARLRSDLEATAAGQQPRHELEHRIRDASGQWRWVFSRGVVQHDVAGRAVRMAGSITDTTEFRAREQRVRQESQHDAVTDLPKREAFLRRLARAVELAREYDDHSFVVLLVDVDRFGMIHDSMGPRHAETVLARIARRITTCLRPEDLVARFGGDKFSILLENLDDPAEGTRIAARIHEAVREPIEVDGEPVYVTVSIGMTSSARHYARVEEVLTDVSAAAFRAKDRGNDRHEVFDTPMRVEAMTMLRLEMALRQAVEREEFELHYQPSVEIASRRVCGFEALLRWQHPKRGRISPAEFIPVAEYTGLIVPIGRWALAEASKQLAAWRDAHPELAGQLTLSVNVSARQLANQRLVDDVKACIERHALPPRVLRLEITESVLMANADMVIALLEELRRAGVGVWLDDFGTGYSSLSYLHRFPVDGLKVDRSFVMVLDGTAASATMVRTILGLAQNIGIETVAEGIELPVQADQLVALGCTRAQGYLWCKPVPAGEASAIVARGRIDP